MSKVPFAAGKVLLLAVFTVFSVSAAQAAPTDSSGPSGAGGDKVYSLGDFFGGIGDLFSGSDEAPKKAEIVPHVAPEESTEKVIHAKRMDAEPEEKTKEEKTEDKPYKVYRAPVVAEDLTIGYGGASSLSGTDGVLSGWGAPEVKIIDPKKIAPVGVLSVTDALQEETSKTVVPPVSALPRQYFPILPFGANAEIPPQYLPIASSEPLDADHEQVARAIIYVHDITRNAAEGVATLMTLGGSNGRDTLILAPQFSLRSDITRFASRLPEGGKSIASWPLENGWNEGGLSFLITGDPRGVSSFTALDLLLLYLGDRQRFPEIRDVVVVGHGTGADFVQRYAATGQSPDILRDDRINVRFVAANASSYLYFTKMRPFEGNALFRIPKDTSCDKVNHYPYGLEELPAYPRRAGASAIRLRYPERHVTYLAGDRIPSDTLLDSSCAASTQGPSRASRLEAYHQHIAQSFGESVKGHIFKIVKNAGYDPVSVLGSSCGMSALFGDGECK
jgi:hypothetical protein